MYAKHQYNIGVRVRKYVVIYIPTQKYKYSVITDCDIILHKYYVTPRSHGYGDVTASYIRRSEIPSRIYAKHQYKKESEYGSTWCIIHSNI